MKSQADNMCSVLRCATGNTRDQHASPFVERTSLNTRLHWMQVKFKTVKSHDLNTNEICQLVSERRVRPEASPPHSDASLPSTVQPVEM